MSLNPFAYLIIQESIIPSIIDATLSVIDRKIYKHLAKQYAAHFSLHLAEVIIQYNHLQY
jgi:hypothetical protein